MGSTTSTAAEARQAAELSANAVVGVRYDANEVAAGVTEVLAYGTAVVAQPGGTQDFWQHRRFRENHPQHPRSAKTR